jgi:hypothetical protein
VHQFLSKEKTMSEKQFFSFCGTISLKFLGLKSSTEKMTIVVNFHCSFSK